MRRWILTLTLLLAGPWAHGEEGIVAVLARSQLARLDATAAADPAGARAQTVRRSFENLLQALAIQAPAELRVIRGETLAESLQGHIVLANERLAELNEGERLFILAHELGHIALHHWAQTEQLYLKWVPGAVTPRETEPVAAMLGRDASGQAHRHELEADAYALRALHTLGRDPQDALGVFMHLGVTRDTATHPGTRKRLASLRAAEAMMSVRAAPAGAQAAMRNERPDIPETDGRAD
jgi:Zn-dependent protease with chaperone function